LAGLLGSAGGAGLAGCGASGLAGLLGSSGGSSSFAALANLGAGSGLAGLTGGLGGLPAGTTPANLAALASLQAESSDLGLLSSEDGSPDEPSGSSGLPGLLGAGQSAAATAPLQKLVGQVAQSQGVNPALAQAVAKSESGFNPRAVSPVGAQGVMQLMPSTFRQYAQQAGSSGAPSGLPVSGAKVSQHFGPTMETMEPPLDWNGTHYAHFHTGVDLAVAQGTPIRATMAGTIQIRSDPSGFGNLIVLENGPWDLLLGHTSGHPSNIQTGTAVKPGQVIGYVGSTGNSTGPHLHYEIRYNGSIVDPSPFLYAAAPSTSSPFDPVANVKAGVSYLKDMLTRFNNNVPAALAAYNAGPGAVDKYVGVPPYPETQNYVQKTMQYARDLGA
jgi:soluble lytic murein transglycosylase-like protein